MKHSVLAAMIPAMLTATAANAAVIYDKDGSQVDLYGGITAVYHFVSDHTGAQDNYNGYMRGDQTYARLGFKVNSKINDHMQSFGRFEYNFAVNQSNNYNGPSQLRFAFAGVKDDRYGSINYGRNWGIAYDIMGYTDMLTEWGEDTQGYMLETTNNYTGSAPTMFGTGRSDSLLQYRNTWDKFNLALQLMGPNDNYNGDSTNHNYSRAVENGTGYAVAMSYDFDMGLTLGATYNTASKSPWQKANIGNDKNAELVSLGAKYSANNIYAAINYTQTRNQMAYSANPQNSTLIGTDYPNSINDYTFASTSQAVTAVAQYTFSNGLTSSLAYGQGWLRRPNGYVGNQNYTKYVDLELVYALGSNLNAFVDYKINLMQNNSYTATNAIYTNNVMAVGMQYSF
ncbi:MAG: porin [Plesiomonas sp.]|uniref:porin n=1 Tax=Plesiomonas sp. TaxID=2486279 RepID=UPI003F34168D